MSYSESSSRSSSSQESESSTSSIRSRSTSSSSSSSFLSEEEEYTIESDEIEQLFSVPKNNWFSNFLDFLILKQKEKQKYRELLSQEFTNYSSSILFSCLALFFLEYVYSDNLEFPVDPIHVASFFDYLVANEKEMVFIEVPEKKEEIMMGQNVVLDYHQATTKHGHFTFDSQQSLSRNWDGFFVVEEENDRVVFYNIPFNVYKERRKDGKKNDIVVGAVFDSVVRKSGEIKELKYEAPRIRIPMGYKKLIVIGSFQVIPDQR